MNAYTVVLADDDPVYADVLASGINLPDGRPIALLSRLCRHKPALSQVRGPQLFLDTFDVGRESGIRHFLLGSTPEVLSRLQHNLYERFPGIQIVGVESPPFRSMTPDELAAQDARIASTNPDVVWVGLGTPKQDHEARRLARSTGTTAIAVGAAFDFAAGTLPEAPSWMTKIGCEWLFRLCTEPRRLWRRYLIGNAKFLRIAILFLARSGDDER